MRKVVRISWVIILLAGLSLSACTPQSSAFKVFGDNTKASPTASLIKSEAALSSTATKSPVETEFDQQIIRTYHTLLMLERADDLMLTAIQKLQTGELSGKGATSLDPYTEAFRIAVEAFNRTAPPSGIFNHGWKNVSKVTAQYLNVYTALIQGQEISRTDQVNLGILRQLLTNYQNNAEGYLKARGLGSEFFTSQHQVVEIHFKINYDGMAVPTLSVQSTTLPSVTPEWIQP